MKKLLVLISVVSLTLLTSCFGGETETPSTNTGTTATGVVEDNTATELEDNTATETTETGATETEEVEAK